MTASASTQNSLQRSIGVRRQARSEEHTSELQSQSNLVCRLLLEKKKEKGCGRVSAARRLATKRPPPATVRLHHDFLRLRRARSVLVPTAESRDTPATGLTIYFT